MYIIVCDSGDGDNHSVDPVDKIVGDSGDKDD